jgi:hypothetical protein
MRIHMCVPDCSAFATSWLTAPRRGHMHRYTYPEVDGHHAHQHFRMGQFGAELFQEMELPRHNCHRVAFHPTRNDRLLVVAHVNKTVLQANTRASHTDRVGQMLCIDVGTGLALWVVDSEPSAPLYWPTNPAFSASGSHFAIAGRDADGRCTVWVVESERGDMQGAHVVPLDATAVGSTPAPPAAGERAMPMHVSWSTGGQTVAGVDGPVSRIAVAWSAYDTTDDEVNEVAIFPMKAIVGDHGTLHAFAGHHLLGEHASRITCCDFSPDGASLVTSTRDGVLLVHSMDDLGVV